MTPDNTSDNTPDDTAQAPSGQPDSDAPAVTPRTWLGRIARRKRKLAHERWSQLDQIAREGISDEDYATTMATLEAMARNLGWDERQASDAPHGHRERARTGHGHRHHRMRHGRCGERATVEA